MKCGEFYHCSGVVVELLAYGDEYARIRYDGGRVEVVSSIWFRDWYKPVYAWRHE